MGNEYFRYQEDARQLIGEESGDAYRVGQRLQLRLADANPVSGALRFELPGGSYGRGPGPRKDRVRKPPPMGRRGRPANIRHQGRKKR
jgi:ribonuclease R